MKIFLFKLLVLGGLVSLLPSCMVSEGGQDAARTMRAADDMRRIYEGWR